MTRQEITSIAIECRRGSGYPVWNILMMVEPRAGASLRYKEMVSMAEKVLWESKELRANDGWYVANAEVMGWSACKKSHPQHRGVDRPHEYRITLDIVNSKDEDNGECSEVFEHVTRCRCGMASACDSSDWELTENPDIPPSRRPLRVA